jgi:hypothetical protein
LELRPIGLGTERAHVLAHLVRVGLEVGVAEALVGRLERVEVPEEWGLGVDDEVATTGELDDQVGTAPALRRS